MARAGDGSEARVRASGGVDAFVLVERLRVLRGGSRFSAEEDCRGEPGSDGHARGNRLGAELAASRVDRDVAEALRAHLGGWGREDGIKFFDQVLRRDDEEEVDHGSEDEEVDYRGEEVTVVDLAAVDMADEVAEVWLADKGAEQGVDDLVGQGGNDAGEGGADDDGDGEVHHIAAQDEVTKAFEHEYP